MAIYDERGREIPDPTPVAMPINYQRPESLTDMMRRMIRTQMSEVAENAGAESFEEANDFDIEDEDPEYNLTRYEELGSMDEIQDATPGGVEPPTSQTAVSPPVTPAGGSGEPPAAPGQTAAGQSAGTATVMPPKG